MEMFIAVVLFVVLNAAAGMIIGHGIGVYQQELQCLQEQGEYLPEIEFLEFVDLTNVTSLQSAIENKEINEWEAKMDQLEHADVLSWFSKDIA